MRAQVQLPKKLLMMLIVFLIQLCSQTQFFSPLTNLFSFSAEGTNNGLSMLDPNKRTGHLRRPGEY